MNGSSPSDPLTQSLRGLGNEAIVEVQRRCSSAKKRRLLNLSPKLPLLLNPDEANNDNVEPVTFGEVHNETSMGGNWESYPLSKRNDKKFRGFRDNANYYVREEGERLLQFILRRGLERYAKGK